MVGNLRPGAKGRSVASLVGGARPPRRAGKSLAEDRAGGRNSSGERCRGGAAGRHEGEAGMAARVAAVVAGIFSGLVAGTALEAAEWPPAPAGSVARDTRRAALDELPLDRMDPACRQEIEHFHRSTTIHRRLPVEAVRCDRELLEFVLAKPEALVDVWRVLGISRVSLDAAGPNQWRLADGYGTVGSVTLLHRERTETGNLWVFLGRGGYAGPLSPRDLTGSCLVVVRHESAGAGLEHLELEAFLDVDGLGLEIVTRSLKPLIVHSAAVNVHEICLFVSQLAAAADRNPIGMARLADKLSRTPPDDRRLLARLASGQGSGSGGGDDGEAMHEELAARWLPAEALEATRR